jgi:RNA polymerase sigma-70 factor (ECF subfamily)
MWRVVNIFVEAPDEAIEAVADETFDFEALFRRHYGRIALAAVRIVRDPARAEEIATEAFWKLWRKKAAQNGNTVGWLYRTAVRMALDELRQKARRIKRESESVDRPADLSPEDAHGAEQERDRVRQVLACLEPRQAELLLLRNNDLSYAEVAEALELNPSSVGTLISRARQAFRREYVTRYGEPDYE